MTIDNLVMALSSTLQPSEATLLNLSNVNDN